MPRAPLLQHFESAGVRHVQVQDREIVLALFDERPRAFPIARQIDQVMLSVESALEERAKCRIVLRRREDA